MQILLLAGSARPDSWNTRLLQTAALHLPAHVTTVWAPAPDSFPHFGEHIEAAAFENGPVAELCAAVAQADLVLMATPEYNQSIPGALKNMLDWLSRRADDIGFEDKPVAIAGATVGPWGTRLAQAHLRHVVGTMGMRIVGRPLYVAHAERRYDADRQTWDADLESRIGSWTMDAVNGAASHARNVVP